MATNAINNTAAILANSAGQYQGANARIFDAITQAADAYEARQRAKDAALDAERKRQADAAAAAQAVALDAEKVTMQVLTKYNNDPASVTHQDRAAFDAAQSALGAKVSKDLLGDTYKPYAPITLGGATMPADMMTPVVQVESLPPATSPTAALMTPVAQAPAGGLLPPPAPLKAGETRMAMTSPTTTPAAAPAPLGQPPVKTPVKFSPPASNIGTTTFGKMKSFEAELGFYRDQLMKNFDAGLTEEASIKSKQVVEEGLKKLNELNEKLKQSGGIVTGEEGLLTRAGKMARGTTFPVVGNVGATGEKLIDPKVQEIRSEYENTLNMLFPFYAKASNLSATAIDTEAARQAIMKSMGDPYGQYNTNKNQLSTLSNMIGTGEIAKQAASDIDQSDPRVKKALEAGYTAEQIKAFLNGK